MQVWADLYILIHSVKLSGYAPHHMLLLMAVWRVSRHAFWLLDVSIDTSLAAPSTLPTLNMYARIILSSPLVPTIFNNSYRRSSVSSASQEASSDASLPPCSISTLKVIPRLHAIKPEWAIYVKCSGRKYATELREAMPVKKAMPVRGSLAGKAQGIHVQSQW